MPTAWIDTLKRLVEGRPCVILRFSIADWEQLNDSRRGVTDFTFARRHGFFEGIKVPTLCLLFFSDPGDSLANRAYLGIISSRGAISSFDTRIKVKHAIQISPATEREFQKLVIQEPHAGNLRKKLKTRNPILHLSPKLSSAVVDALARLDLNRGAMRTLAEISSGPKHFRGASALQEDAVHTALKAFNLADDRAVAVELVEGRQTALARIPIREDSVIEHDARSVPGYEIIMSDVTGRAIFEKESERLEIFTANHRQLEEVFGVDLIYLNLIHQNIIMVQYKMLEPHRPDDDETDWLYRPDAQLDEEIRRMDAFVREQAPGPLEYRLNPEVFYLKFVKRDGAISNGGIVVPIDHYKKLIKDPSSIGSKGALRISYDRLGGQYMRQGAFLDLIRSGYIGAHADNTQYLSTLVRAVLAGNRSVVAALQTRLVRNK